MSDLSHFESRSGQLTCSNEDVYSFVTDIRNFEQFVPEGTISNWQADKESCSFSVSMMGIVSVRITEKEQYCKVVYSGDALKKNDFSIILKISDLNTKSSEVKVMLNADLNPMLKTIAAKPIAQFLEMLIGEMEKFEGWKDVKE
jgi:hypothetical protein